MNQKRCFVCCIVAKLQHYFLWRRYKFDRWHASAPWHCRPYKKQVVQLASIISPEAVMEIGCGLGDIISRIKANKRFGFDIDENVIRAAKQLHPNGVEFNVASLFDSNEIKKISTKVDLLIMVNWPHGVPIEDIRNALHNIKSELELKYLLIDEIKQGVKGYRFYHSSESLSQIGKIISTVEALDGVRNLHLIKLKSDL